MNNFDTTITRSIWKILKLRFLMSSDADNAISSLPHSRLTGNTEPSRPFKVGSKT